MKFQNNDDLPLRRYVSATCRFVLVNLEFRYFALTIVNIYELLTYKNDAFEVSLLL